MTIFTSINDLLRLKGCPERRIRRFYSEWEIFPGFFIYSFENNFAFGSNKLFVDAGLVDLKLLLERIPGVVSPQGMTPNKTFERFALYPVDRSARLVPCGWKFQFSYKDALNNFLNACECYAGNGLMAASMLVEADGVRPRQITERRVSTEVRIGQNEFRRGLLEYWRTCSVTGLSCVEMLRASHIKPWSKSNPEERLDVFNGLLLSPNFDSLFDLGLISFKDDGVILISPVLNEADRLCMGVDTGLRLRRINGAHLKYLEYHRLHVLRGC